MYFFLIDIGTHDIISEGRVLITWTTDRNVKTELEYGLTTSYGNTYVHTDNNTRKTHTVIIENLPHVANWHFRIIAKDGNFHAYSQDLVFRNYKVVFVSSEKHAGNFGGVTGADGVCQNLANSFLIYGTFKAWLSSSTENAIDRIGSTGPWYLVDGTTKVADSSDDLWTPESYWGMYIDNPITLTEKGAVVLMENSNNQYTASVWTGSNYRGTYTGSNCTDWQSSDISAYGTVGATYYQLTSSPAYWTNSWTATCSEQKHIYCFQYK